MIQGDWYEWMNVYENSPAHFNRYLIDCVGGRIRVYRARDSSLVGSFTVEQVKRFFYGVSSCSYNTNFEVMNEVIQCDRQDFEMRGIDYKVQNDNMTLFEEYAYLVATDFDTFDTNISER